MKLPVPGRRKEDIDALLQRGLLINLSEDLVSTEDSVNKVQQVLSSSFGEDPFRLGELREALGVSRKIALMWAEVLDSRKITRRDGESRRLV